MPHESRSREAQALWDEAIHKQSDISPASEKNFRIFTTAYASLPARLKLSPKGHVLDLGCGTGFVSHVFSGNLYQVTGVDISPQSVGLAQKRNPQARFVVGDMTAVPLPDAAYDVLVAITSLEFCEKKEKVLTEAKRLLKPGGVFYVEVRNASFPLLAFPAVFRRLLEKTGLLEPVALSGFCDLRYAEWKKLFSKQGWECSEEYCALRPWNYGSIRTRMKQCLIALVRTFFPRRFHYMNAFLLRPAAQ